MQFSSDYFTWDIYVQGFFMAICVLLGAYIFFTDHLSSFQNTANFQAFSTALGKMVKGFVNIAIGREMFSYGEEDKEEEPEASDGETKGKKPKRNNRFRISAVGFVLLILLLTYVCGIISNSLSDRWMDERNIYHFGLKVLWWNPHEESELHQFTTTDDDLKIKAFDLVIAHEYPELKALTGHQKVQLYYYAKHYVTQEGTFSKDLSQSQVLVDFSQSMCLSFFILFAACVLNFLSMSYRHFGVRLRFILIFFIGLVALFAMVKVMYPELLSHLFGKHAWPGFFGYVVIAGVLVPGVVLTTFIFSRKKKLFYQFLTTSAILYVAFFGYFGNAINWKHNESAIAGKVFGYYKFLQSSELGIDEWDRVREVTWPEKALEVTIPETPENGVETDTIPD